MTASSAHFGVVTALSSPDKTGKGCTIRHAVERSLAWTQTCLWCAVIDNVQGHNISAVVVLLCVVSLACLVKVTSPGVHAEN